MQNLADRKYMAPQCPPGKPCALRNRINAKKHYQICLCGVKHGSIDSLARCERYKKNFGRACRMSLLETIKSNYNPAVDMCTPVSPDQVVMDPVKDVNKNYVSCKQAVGMQNLADRKYMAPQCPPGKPCALRNRINAKKHYQICLCGVKHGSIDSLARCERYKRNFGRACRMSLLETIKSNYNPAVDICKPVSPNQVVMDPVKDVNKNYV